MPHFYFDVGHDETCRRDETGINLQRIDDVPYETFVLLTNFVQDRMLVGHHVLEAQVRDETGAVVFVTTLTVEGRRLV